MLNNQKDLRTGNPIWNSQPQPQLPVGTLTSDRKTEIVVVGAGITGAMIAEALSERGFSVIILDRRGPCKGATSASTALLQYEIDTPLSLLTKQIGRDKAIRSWRRSKLALDSLQDKIASLGLRCGLQTLPSLYLSGDILDADGLKGEQALRQEAGLFSEFLPRNRLRDDFNIGRMGALKSFGNLTINPVRLAGGFLRAALRNGAQIFVPVNVTDVHTHRDGVEVITEGGQTIRAKYLVYATGYEIPKALGNKRNSVQSTYAIATRPQPENLWPLRALIWEASDPYLYLRCTNDGRIICGGMDEPFEDEAKRDGLLPRKAKALEARLKDLFPNVDNRATFTWCGSFGASTTGLPTIGRTPGMPNCFAIMAFGGNGTTFSRLGAELVLGLIEGKSDPDADIFAF